MKFVLNVSRRVVINAIDYGIRPVRIGIDRCAVAGIGEPFFI